MSKHEIAPRWIMVVGAALLLTAACHEMVDNTPADYQTMKEVRPVGNTKQLDVRLQYDVGALEIRSGNGDDLFSLNLDYDANRTKPKFDFNESGDRATMRLTMDGNHIGFNNSKRANDLTLTFNDKVPLDLDLTAGVSDSHLDMTDLDLKRFHLRGGVGKTEVSFDRPTETSMSSFEVECGVGNLIIRGLGNARAEQLKVTGGVGRTDLDFTGDLQNTQIDSEISVGVGQVRLVLPREVGVRIEADGSFLSNISAPGFEKDGNTYTRRGSDNSTKIVIRVRSGVGGVTVELI
jgi:N-terminal domain of toast_rack, DUF2154